MVTKFPSKIFVFGEYTILLDGPGLVIPCENFSSEMIYQTSVDESLLGFIEYLKTEKLNTALKNVLDYEKIEREVLKGWSVQTNIPYGKGLGSSGAFVSCFYESFRKSQLNGKKLLEALGVLESYFHHTSSGLDPYVSYTKEGQLININESKKLVSFNHLSSSIFSKVNLRLVDSKIQRTASQYVKIFIEKSKSQKYISKLKDYYLPHLKIIFNKIKTDQSIEIEELLKLSEMQLEYFKEMFPERIRKLAKDYLDKGMALKLCGAGGGGYYQLFSKTSKTVTYQNKNVVSISLIS